MSGVSNNTIRFTGMASGLDTDSIVKELMSVEKIKVDRVDKDKKVLEWKRDDYREITNLLRGFKDDFFDVLKTSSNMRSQSNYKVFSAQSSGSSYVTAKAGIDAVAGNHTIEVTQLATAAVMKSTGTVSKELVGSGVPTYNNGEDFNITLDGVTKNIAITAGMNEAQLEAALDAAFGSDKIDVTLAAGLKFTAKNGATKISLSSGTNDALGDLGFTSGASNRISTSSTLESLSTQLGFTLDADDEVKLNINGKDFEFSKTISLSEMMSEINSDATANVTMQYDEVSDTFSITAKQTGAGSTLIVTETGSNFLTTVNLSTITGGKDAKAEIDGQSITRSSNTFTVSGVTYTALKETTAAETITVSQDVDAVYDKIKAFVDKYNEVIEKINGELSEEYDRDYLPLTDEEKEAMSDEEVEKWEEKAKAGLLRNDSILQGIVQNMRRALYDTVDGVSGGIASIGITTGTYQENGKLIIDETKLKDAITNSPDKVMNLFSKESDISYSSTINGSGDRSTRYNENGLVQRLYDIIEDNIRTTRDSGGKKGLLLEKAGISGDITEFNNILSNQIYDKETLIDELWEKYYDKEESYYDKFTAMETALNNMNSQSAWLSSQFSG